MTSIKEAIELKEKCLSNAIIKLKQMLNSHKKYNIKTLHGVYAYNGQPAKIAMIADTADLIREYQTEIATLRKFE